MTLMPKDGDRRLFLTILGLTLTLLIHVGMQIFEYGKLTQKVDDMNNSLIHLEQVVLTHIAK